MFPVRVRWRNLEISYVGHAALNRTHVFSDKILGISGELYFSAVNGFIRGPCVLCFGDNQSAASCACSVGCRLTLGGGRVKARAVLACHAPRVGRGWVTEVLEKRM